jgi:hypothetical protein
MIIFLTLISIKYVPQQAELKDKYHFESMELFLFAVKRSILNLFDISQYGTG